MKIGLVLSGGFAKGAYQIGALRAIREYFEPGEIEYVSASSIGSFNSFIFSCDCIDEGEKMWLGITPDGGKKLVTRLIKSDYLKGIAAKLSREKLLSKKHYVSLFRLKKMDVSYIDVANMEPDDISLRLQAAIALPVFTTGVKINGERFYDGGTVDNIPVYPLTQHDLDYIICIYFDEYNYSFEDPTFDDKIIKITFDDDDKIMSNSIWVTKEGTENMISDGYIRAKYVLDLVFEGGTQDKEKVYEQIQKLNALYPDKQLRITTEVAVHKLNKMMKTFSKRRIIE